MNSSRPRTSVEVIRKPRHGTRKQQEPAPASFSTYFSSGIMSDGFVLTSGPPDFYPEVSQCWPVMTEGFYSGSDSAHIPALSVAPTDLTHHWDPMATMYDLELSSASSGSSSKSSYSPPMSGAEMMPINLYHSPMEQYEHYPGQMATGSLTSPTEPSLFGDLEFFSNDRNDPMVMSLSEPVNECEYLGVSKLQFSRSICLLRRNNSKAN